MYIYTLFILFPGCCRPLDPPHGRAGVLGDPFLVAFFLVFMFYLICCCGFQASGAISSFVS